MPDRANDSAPGKLQAAKAAADLVEQGMAVGLGTGSTSVLVVKALGERVAHEGLRIVGVPTSVSTAELANTLRIPLRDLDDVDSLDINLDGADEIDPAYRMIKGRGGALLREKIVASSARLRVTVVTPDKRVNRLGEHFPVPVEVSSIGTRHVERRIQEIATGTSLRLRDDGSPYQTDGGNRIIDCRFASIDDPAALEKALHAIVGVFETGLFLGLCDMLIVGYDDRVETSRSNVRPLAR